MGDDIDLSGVEDEDLVDPVDLAAEYNLDDPVRMYLKAMIAEIREKTVRTILSVVPRAREEVQRVQVANPLQDGFEGQGKKSINVKRINVVRREAAKVGRNDACPCGSGKKYKNCCGLGK